MKNCIVSCTPAGILEILKEYNIKLEGKQANDLIEGMLDEL